MECGITVVTSSIGLSLTVLGVTGFGNFFYNSTNILRYVGSVGSLSSNGVTSLSNATLVSGMYTFTSPLTITSLPTFRQLPITIGTTPVNLYGTLGTLKNATTTKPIFIDSNSITNSLTAFPGSYNINQISFFTSTSFVRVYSTMDPTGCTKRPSTSTINDITIGGTSYATSIYDNTKSLTTEYTNYTNELLYTGMTTMSSIFVGGPSTTYYTNYNNYEYNTNANYSGITSGTRYATFAWRVNPAVFSNSTSYNTINFTLQSISGMTVTNGTIYPTGSSTPLFIYYRLEDSGSLSLPSNGPNACITTFWINANDISGSSGTAIGSGNCHTNDSTFSSIQFYTTAPNASGTSNITFSVKTNGYALSSSNKPTGSFVHIYLRIGLPIQATNLYFTNITCALAP
jgi:hypothetical protein